MDINRTCRNCKHDGICVSIPNGFCWEPVEEEKEVSEGKPGLKYDDGKLRFDLIPTCAEEGLAKALTYGANKYEANSWQNVENFKNRYYAALRRHLNAYWKGESHDQESGLHNLELALTNITFLLWKEIQEEI